MLRLYPYAILFILAFPLRGLPNSTTDLSYSNLTSIPETVRDNSNLKILNLSGNPLKQLPVWLRDLSSLETIMLNDVTTLNTRASFEVLKNCKSLKKIIWQRGKLTYIPQNFTKCDSLIEVDFSKNAIVKIPILSEILHVKILNFESNLLDSLDESFSKFQNLATLNIAFNPGANNNYNHKILKEITSLKTLVTGGLHTVPISLSELDFLTHLTIKKSKITSLPSNFFKLINLKSIHVSNCTYLNASEFIDDIATLPLLKALTIDNSGFERIPININKLQSLTSLSIINTCISHVPNTLSSMNIKRFSAQKCTIHKGLSLTKKLFQLKSLQYLKLASIQCYPHFWDIKQQWKIDSLDISGNALSAFPGKTGAINWVNAKGNHIPSIQLKEVSLQYVEDSKTLALLPSPRRQQKKSSISDTIKSSKITNDFQKIIYSEIGDIFTFRGIEFNVPKEAFLYSNSNIVKGDVTLSIKDISAPGDITRNDIHFSVLLKNKKQDLLNPTFLFEIKASIDDTSLYLNPSVGITVQSTNASHGEVFFRYHTNYKKQWSELPVQSLVCENASPNSKKTSFKSVVAGQLKKYPQNKKSVNRSNVFVKLKRNKRKKLLLFSITPEYGYVKNFFQLFGDKIKGYPELKVYKDIQWQYTGNNLDSCLKRLYLLNDFAKLKKLNAGNSFKFFTNNIKDIYIHTHPTSDCYVMTILAGRDTLKINVLPKLKLLKTNKIQRWHQKRFKKYSKELAKRRQNWDLLDSLHLNYIRKSEFREEQFRSTLIDKYSQFKTPQNTSPLHQNPLFSTTYKLNKLGLISIGKPLRLVDDTSAKKLHLLVSNKTTHTKKVLIYNKVNHQLYWQHTSNVTIRKNYTSEVFCKIGNNVYKSSWEKGNNIHLHKYTP